MRTIVPAQPGFKFHPNDLEEECYEIIAWLVVDLPGGNCNVHPITVRGAEEAQYDDGKALNISSAVFKDGFLQ